jgi:hypothetical protein
MSPLVTIYVLWLVFFLSWIAAALIAGPTVKEGHFWQRQLHRIVIVAGFIPLLGLANFLFPAQSPLWHLNDTVGWILVGIQVLGFGFAWWSRVTLTRAQMAHAAAQPPEIAEPYKKGDLRRAPEKKHIYLIVDRGPYALARHPVSTAMIVSGLATAAALATLVSFVGAAIMIFGFWLRARSEDAVLHSMEGGAFDVYAAKVPMLVPFWPTRAPEETRPSEPAFTAPKPAEPPAAPVSPAPAEGAIAGLAAEPTKEAALAEPPPSEPSA